MTDTNKPNDLPDGEPPASPTEQRLALFLAQVLDRRQSGQPIDVNDMLVDRPDLVERGRQLVEGLEALRGAPANAGAAEEAFPSTLAPRAGQPLPPLRRLGLYELLRPLGAPSGQGEVWLARHPMLKVLCAVKMLRPDRLGHEALARFRREIEAHAQLEHPNIVGIRHAEEVDGQPILVMKYVDGFSLHELVQRHGPLPVADACELIHQAAKGLQFAHEHSIVHRDVKPGNLMVDRTLTVKVLDFGLARGRADSAGEPITVANTLLGTAAYMAPEQAQGSSQVDIRADLYGLGCTLYFLLTAESPYEAEANGNLFTLLNAHCNSPVPSIRKRRPDVPELLATLIEKKLLAKLPSDRLATPAQLVASLQGFACGHNLGQLLGVPAQAAERPAGTLPLALPPGVDAPLDAALELVFWDANEKRRVGLDDPGVLPVKEGDEFRIAVRLNRPAFVYLIWIDSQGNVAPVYPWDLGSDWELAGAEQARPSLTLPAGEDGTVLPISGPAGVETLVLLAREEPLSSHERGRFTSWLPVRFPRPGSLPNPARPSWLTCRQEECEAGTGVRGFGPPRAPVDPLNQLDALLRERLGPRFRLIQAVSFVNLGPKGGQS